MSLERKALGSKGEQAATVHLQGLGYRLLEKNRRARQGEVDLILIDQDTLVFCEVKTKRSTQTGHAAESYGKKQQKRMRLMILRYLQKSGWSGPVRIDVIALQKEKQSPHFALHHYKDALSLDDTW